MELHQEGSASAACAAGLFLLQPLPPAVHMDTSGRQWDLLGPSCWRRDPAAQSAGPTLADDAADDDAAVVVAASSVLVAVDCPVMFKCNECESVSRKVAGLGEHTGRTELAAPLIGGESSRPGQS